MLFTWRDTSVLLSYISRAILSNLPRKVLVSDFLYYVRGLESNLVFNIALEDAAGDISSLTSYGI